MVKKTAPASTPEDAVALVVLDGSWTVQRSTELKGRIVDALSRSRRVTVDLGRVEELDLSCLQVFLAAKASAGECGTALTFSPERSRAVAMVLEKTGLDL